MSLEDDLAALRARRAELLDAGQIRILEDALERLRMLQIAETAPQPGEPFPDFTLVGETGSSVTSAQLLDAGPLVLVFFRGGWCEYCDAAMHAVDRVAPAIASLGVGLVGVLPENTDTLCATRRSKGVGFRLLSDPGGHLARLCGLQFDLTPGQVALYADTRGLDLPRRHAGSGWELPVPAAYVITSDGSIAFAFADPDYTRRADPERLVEAARAVVLGGDHGQSGLGRQATSDTGIALAGRSAMSTNALTGGE